MQDRGSEANARQLRDTQMPHDGGICQQEQRFSNQGAKGGDGETKDFPGMSGGRCCSSRGGLVTHGASLAGTRDIPARPQGQPPS